MVVRFSPEVLVLSTKLSYSYSGYGTQIPDTGREKNNDHSEIPRLMNVHPASRFGGFPAPVKTLCAVACQFSSQPLCSWFEWLPIDSIYLPYHPLASRTIGSSLAYKLETDRCRVVGSRDHDRPRRRGRLTSLGYTVH
jgi:hypothetical protein